MPKCLTTFTGKAFESSVQLDISADLSLVTFTIHYGLFPSLIIHQVVDILPQVFVEINLTPQCGNEVEYRNSDGCD